jgi:hypothetical protein
MISRQLSTLLFFQPADCFSMLTSRAMTVATAYKDFVGFGAMLTLIQSETIGGGFTVEDGVNDFFVFQRYGISVLLQVFVAMLSEDIVNDAHFITSAITWLMRK